MKLRTALMFLLAIALVAAGCGGDDDNKKKDDEKAGKKDTAKMSDSEKVVVAKRDSLNDAKKSFEDKPTDVNICRDLAMRYIAVASPESTDDPKKAPELPKDRDESLKGAVSTLESCTKIDAKNRDVKQMLASTYMATGSYDKASPLLKELAGTAKGAERANAYYAWGLAASNATDYAEAIQAWTRFIGLSPKNDPRIAQVKQSITALKAAQKAPKPAAAPAAAAAADADAAKADDATGAGTADDTAGGDNADDNGGDDAAADDNSGDDN